MIKKQMCLIASLILVPALFAAGCGKQTPPAAPEASVAPAEALPEPAISPAGSEESAPAPVETAERATDAETTEDTEGLYRGVVIDAAMHSVVLQTDKGKSVILSYPEENPDLSGLGNEGIVIGMGVEITVDDNDKVTSMKRIPTASEDTEALRAIANLVTAASFDDFDSFRSSVMFPVTSGKKKVSESEFTEDVYWTDPLKSMLSSLDLLKLEKNNDSFVIQNESPAPSVTVSRVNDEWYVTEIDP